MYNQTLLKNVETASINKKLAFKNKDKAGVTSAQKELNIALTEARTKFKNQLEDSFISMDTKQLWNSIKHMINMNSSRAQLSSLDDLRRADDLSDFFLRFETQNFSQAERCF